MAKGITLKDKNGSTLYPKTVADLVLDSETGEPIGKVITSLGKITTDEEKKWLRVEGEEGKRYFVALTELSVPNYPTINTTIYNVVEGSFNITVTNNTTGATMEYMIDDSGSWKTIVNNAITYNTGYTNENDNQKKKLKIHLRAKKNGVESGVNIVDITVYPKVASGKISVKRSGNNNDYSTEAEITITKSPTTGAETKYQVGEGAWTTLEGDTKIIKSTETTDQGYYKVKAEKGGDYKESDVVSNSQFTLGKKKFYYGRGPEELTSEEDIKSLTGGGNKEQSTMAGKYEITSTEPGLFTWFCGEGTLSSVTSSGFSVPMEGKQTIEGYNCYRSTSPVQEIGTDTFVVS